MYTQNVISIIIIIFILVAVIVYLFAFDGYSNLFGGKNKPKSDNDKGETKEEKEEEKEDFIQYHGYYNEYDGKGNKSIVPVQRCGPIFKQKCTGNACCSKSGWCGGNNKEESAWCGYINDYKKGRYDEYDEYGDHPWASF